MRSFRHEVGKFWETNKKVTNSSLSAIQELIAPFKITPIDDDFCMVDFQRDIRIIQGLINLVCCTITTVANRDELVKQMSTI